MDEKVKSESKPKTYFLNKSCPYCEQGCLCFRKASRGLKFLFCDECDAIYFDPRTIEISAFCTLHYDGTVWIFDSSDPLFKTDQVFVVGEAGLMNLLEIKEMGWEDLIGGTF
jgi:ribosomal protein S27E